MSIRRKRLPIVALERIDDRCADFERAWRNDQSPSIESAISEVEDRAECDVLLAELIALDIDYRRLQGATPSPGDYLDRFPDQAEVVNEAFGAVQKDARAFEPPTVEQLSEMFPALEIMELIGAGGMGAVYKARQSGLDRIVALKILPEEFGHDIKFALRFTREARTLAKLNHPNIVSVFEFGNVADTYYFLMEFVEGSTLREVVRAGQLDPEHALAIVPHLCDALQYAHDKGVIHRDIKPENILIASDGAVKIADFGLSRILGSEGQHEGLTGTHQVMGTPRYMAPEQMESTRGVDHRADIYSLGVVFYEMLTGELPMGYFAAPSQKVNIDVRLDEVVLRTLEKEPQRRYQRASQIKSDVQSITSTREQTLQPTVIYDAASKSGQHIDGDVPLSGRHHQESRASQPLAHQELAGRMLLTRRQLMERVESCLRPLFRWQLLLIVAGVGLVCLGAYCWAPNPQITHRLVCGLIVHIYGVLVISQGILVCTRIRRVDTSKSLTEIRGRLDSLRSGYLRAGVIVGFVWWWMWIPATVAFGFDQVLTPYSLVPALVVGILGFLISFVLYWRALRPSNPSAEAWRQKLSGKSIPSAYLALDEIEQAQID